MRSTARNTATSSQADQRRGSDPTDEYGRRRRIGSALERRGQARSAGPCRRISFAPSTRGSEVATSYPAVGHTTAKRGSTCQARSVTPLFGQTLVVRIDRSARTTTARHARTGPARRPLPPKCSFADHDHRPGRRRSARSHAVRIRTRSHAPPSVISTSRPRRRTAAGTSDFRTRNGDRASLKSPAGETRPTADPGLPASAVPASDGTSRLVERDATHPAGGPRPTRRFDAAAHGPQIGVCDPTAFPWASASSSIPVSPVPSLANSGTSARATG